MLEDRRLLALGFNLLRDINLSTQSSGPANFAGVGAVLFFAANDGTSGNELWTSDGTEAGTILVNDFTGDGASSNPSSLIEVSGKLFVAATTADYGQESWVADLTPPSLVGDYNQNGTVDAADYVIWRATLGSTTDLRANGDNTGASAGVIDQADYDVWRNNFGNTLPPASGGGTGTAATGAGSLAAGSGAEVVSDSAAGGPAVSSEGSTESSGAGALSAPVVDAAMGALPKQRFYLMPAHVSVTGPRRETVSSARRQTMFTTLAGKAPLLQANGQKHPVMNWMIAGDREAGDSSESCSEFPVVDADELFDLLGAAGILVGF